MAKGLFYLLLALSIGALLKSLRRREGVLQFPALFAGTFLFSIVPQLVNHVFYPGRLPARVYQDHGVEYGLIMCILCLVAGIAGYRGTPRVAVYSNKPATGISVEKLFWAGAVLCSIGLVGVLGVASQLGGLKAQFTEGGHYQRAWSGVLILWAYIGKLLPLGLILCLNSTLIRGNLGKWLFTLAMMLYPLAVIVFAGRRGMTFSIAMIVMVSLWFQRRWAPPRCLSLCGMALGGMFIILVPFYRGYANRTGDIKGAIAQVDVQKAIEVYERGERQEGIDNLIIGIPARLAYPSFCWGTGFWNAAVDYLVSGQMVGYKLKHGLMIRVGRSDEDLFEEYCGCGPEYSSYTTGPYSAFREFCFFGCLLYFGMGRFYRWLWCLADERRDLRAQMIYASCAVLGPVAVVNAINMAFAIFLLPVGVLVPTLWLIRDHGQTDVRLFQPALYPTPRRGPAVGPMRAPTRL
jgi:hypothetical protein